MKNRNSRSTGEKIIVFLIMTAAFIACAGSPRPVAYPLDELNAAIREVSTHFNHQLPAGISLAIVNMETENPAISEYIINTLMENLVNDGYFTVVDRHRLDAIREELMFQMSGEVDDNTAQAIGRMVGAQTIVLGSFTEIASMYRLTVRALSVETAEVQSIFNQSISGTAAIRAFTGRATNIGIGTRAGLYANGE